MALPYEKSSSGQKAMGETQKILQGFGATKFGFWENFETGELTVQFEYQGRQVEVRASSKGYATAWLKHHPYTSRMRATKRQHEEKALKQGQIAVYSILRDWIKGQVTAVETGILTFEGAFLGQLLLPGGVTVLEEIEARNLLPAPEVSHG